MTPTVTISLVTWNSERVLPYCLRSLRAQTLTSIALTIIDNASLDQSIAIARAEAPTASVIQNSRNLGYGRGHNQAALFSRAPYVLFLNPDTVLAPNAIEEMLTVMEDDPGIGAVGPKLLKYELTDDEIDPVRLTDRIDSTGVMRRRFGQFSERGANELDQKQYDQTTDIFAASGACLLVRKRALESIAYRDEFFDVDFFAYKEDIDLGWRLQHRGWKIRLAPRAIVHHRRSAAAPKRQNDPRQIFRARVQRSQLIRTLSYRNHFLMALKNTPAGQLLLSLLWMIPYEIATGAYLFATEPRTLAGLSQAVRLAPHMLPKRRAALTRRS